MREPPRIDLKTTGVLVIDVQRDCLDGSAPIAAPGGLELISAITRLPGARVIGGMSVIWRAGLHV